MNIPRTAHGSRLTINSSFNVIGTYTFGDTGKLLPLLAVLSEASTDMSSNMYLTKQYPPYILRTSTLNSQAVLLISGFLPLWVPDRMIWDKQRLAWPS